MITAEIDPQSMRNLNSAIGNFILQTGRDSDKVLKDQAKLFVKDLIKVTPPFGKATFSESYNEQRKSGEDAVERDIRKVFIPLRVFAESVSSRNPKLAAAILAAGGIVGSNVKTKKSKVVKSSIDMDALDAIFRNMGMEGRVVRYVNPEIHQRARGRRGRVKRATPLFVVSEKSLDSYITSVKKDVGKAKSGWLKAAIGLGVAGIPNWIRRHLTPGVFVDKTLANNPEASITVGNLVEYSGDFDAAKFEAAIQNRQRGMANQLAKMAEHRARKANSGSTV